MKMFEMDWAERLRAAHSMEYAADWQYGRVWRFIPRPDGDEHPEFEPLGPDPLPGDGWELNVDHSDQGLQTRTPAQVDLLMQITYWRRKAPGMSSIDVGHVLNKQVV